MDGARILVGTRSGVWDPSESEPVALAGHEIRSLTRTGDGFAAVVDDHEVWETGADTGWTRLLSIEAVTIRCIYAADDQLLIGCSDARLFAYRRGLEPVESLQAIDGRDAWYTPWGDPPDVRSMAVGPGGRVYVNVHVGGIARSADGGGSWRPTIDIDTDVHQVVYDVGSGQLLAAAAVGLAASADEGETWRIHADGLHGSYLRAVGVADETILVTASTGPSTARGAVYRTPLAGGEPFERCRQGLPEWFPHNIDTFCLAAEGPNVALGTPDGQVFESTDQGGRWQVVSETLPPVLCVLLDVDRSARAAAA